MTGSKFSEFMSSYRVERGADFTHTSLGKPTGSFYIPVDALNTFYTLYIDAYEAGQDLHITEKHRHISPLLIDLDFRFRAPEKDAEGASTSAAEAAPRRTYTHDHMTKFIQLYMDSVREYIDIDTIHIYLMEKPNPTVHQDRVKDGVHIMIPSLVTKPIVQYLVRNKVLETMDEVFGDLALVNEYKDVFDESVIERNNWFLYGSKKPGNVAPYLVTKVYTYNGKDRTLTESENDHSETELIEVLSIRNKYVENSVKIEKAAEVLAFETKMEQDRLRRESIKNIIGGEATLNVANECTNLEKVKKLVGILNPQRCEAYDDWIRLGWCLRNIDHRLFDTWDTLSKTSNKYVPGECKHMWAYMRLGGLGMGTLHMWAKQDNPEQYAEILRHDIKTLLERTYKSGPTHHDVAKVVYEMYRYDFVCASIKQRVWYEFRNHRWNMSDSGYMLSMRISNEVCQEYLAEVGNLQRQISAVASSEDDVKRIGEHIKRCTDIAVKLRCTSFKESVMKECALLFYQEKFEEKLDAYTHLIGFENGVYDLDAMEFREGRPEDYITFSTGNPYVPYDPNNAHVQAIHTYLSQVLPKQDIRDYVLKLFASFLNGAIKEQKFHIWTGTGSNSKSKLVELYERAFGDYCVKFPVTILTGKRPASSAANPELARAKGKRFACLQEPSEDERLNIGFMKELSAGDSIMARPLYRDPFDFRPQFKLLLLCNHLPHVPSDDGGTWRRIRVVEFTSRFVDDPKEENEYPIDLALSEKMVHWQEHFVSLLIETYKRYVKEGVQEPEEVTACTRDYKRQNDHLGDFIYNCVEPCPGAFLPLNEAFNELKAWIKDDNIPMKAPTKAEVEKYMTKNMAKPTAAGMGMKGFRGYRLKNRFQPVPTAVGED